jgi:hypothetical protein
MAPDIPSSVLGTASTDTPVPVPGLIDVSEIAAGENRSFAYGVLSEPIRI